jgi:hypothetical protein
MLPFPLDFIHTTIIPNPSVVDLPRTQLGSHSGRNRFLASVAHIAVIFFVPEMRMYLLLLQGEKMYNPNSLYAQAALIDELSLLLFRINSFFC